MKPMDVIALAVIWIATTVGAVLLTEPNIYWAAAIATLGWLEAPWRKKDDDQKLRHTSKR